MYILIILILVITMILFCCKIKENYHNHEYAYSPLPQGVVPSGLVDRGSAPHPFSSAEHSSYCHHNYYNNPIPSGYEGWKCIKDEDCYDGLKCCFENPGFELGPTSGRCRSVCVPGQYTNLWQVKPRNA